MSNSIYPGFTKEIILSVSVSPHSTQTTCRRCHGAGIEPTTFILRGNGANHRATSCTVGYGKLQPELRKKKTTGPLGTWGPVRCRNAASIISNQPFSCGQSGQSHVARHAHFHFLPNTTTHSMPSGQLAHICLFVPLGSNENKLKSKWFPAWMLPFGSLPVEVRFFFNGMRCVFFLNIILQTVLLHVCRTDSKMLIGIH